MEAGEAELLLGAERRLLLLDCDGECASAVMENAEYNCIQNPES